MDDLQSSEGHHRTMPSVDAVRTFAESRLAFHEKRRSPRQVFVSKVVAQPLSDDWEADGEAFTAVTTDISMHGVALLHNQPVNAPYLAVELDLDEGPRVPAVLRVVRSRPLRDMVHIAGEFQFGSTGHTVEA